MASTRPNLLVTLIGRTPKSEGESYRRTTYRFPDGTTESLAFIGWALQKRYQPERMLILGTAGSMWDHLFEGDIRLGEAEEERRLQLVDRVAKKSVRQTDLDCLAPLLSSRLNCRVSLQIIPACASISEEEGLSEQIEFLRIVADHVQPGDRVVLDVTHGYRHLAMLALLSAFHLELVKGSVVMNILYAPYDPDTRIGSVVDLSGLLRIGRWFRALASFDKDGDYRVLLPLLAETGMDPSVREMFEEAGYRENILDIGRAKHLLKQGTRSLDESGLKDDAQLVFPLLRERLSWVEGAKLVDRQVEVARQALARGDYLRAILLAYEAVVSRVCHLNGVAGNKFEQRSTCKQAYEERLQQAQSEERRLYYLLRDLRNYIAHATSTVGRTEVVSLVQDRASLRKVLTQIVDAIATGQLPTEEMARQLPLS